MFLSRHHLQGCVFPVGTLLEVWSVRFGVHHRGIAGPCSWDGTQQVLHARKRQGVHCSSLIEFAEGQMPKVIRFPQSTGEQLIILRRAYSQIGHPYHLLIANCEHFANWAATGVAYSEQVNNASTIAFTTVCLAVAIFASQNQE